jgi:[protein-PII] uridylyltransferase
LPPQWVDVIQAHGLCAAHERSAAIDRAIRELAGRLAGPLDTDGSRVAIVGLSAYGRREPTPHGDIDVLFLHTDRLDQQVLTREVCYPLWEQHIRLEPLVRTIAECAADVRRSLAAAMSLLDARLITGDGALFAELERQTIEPLRRDRTGLRQRLRPDVEQRHMVHAAVTSSTAPDVVAGRGGLLDATVLRWLERHDNAESTAPAESQDTHRLETARDLLLAVVTVLEDTSGQRAQSLNTWSVDRVAEDLGYADPGAFMRSLRGHARWVAFEIDSAFAPIRQDRQLGPYLQLRRGRLVGTRIPPLEEAPNLGLRAANLAGFAPPAPELMRWASAAGATDGGDGTSPLEWDPAALEQLWLLLRAADWRSFEFLDVTRLLIRYFPELKRVWRAGGADQTLDTHSFQALRRLHAWTDSGDAFAERIWSPLRQRDWVYLAVVLHELTVEDATAAVERLSLSKETARSIGFVASEHGLIIEAAARRDPYDEDVLVELATRIRTRQRLRQLVLVGFAHELAVDNAFANSWRADLVRRLFSSLDALLRQGGEIGTRRSRSVEHHRQHIVAELQRQGLEELEPVVARLPRRYVLARSPAFAVRHLRLLRGEPLSDGEVRLQAHRRPRGGSGAWDVLIVARDRPGLLATFAGVLALRGASVLAADAATCSDGLVLDVFTVMSAYGLPLESTIWPQLRADLNAALQGRLPLQDLLGSPVSGVGVEVRIDNAESQVFSVVEVRAPDQVGLLYRIASALHALQLDIHHARITTPPEGALDVFYVWSLAGNKVDDADVTAQELARRLRGDG